VVVLPTFGAHTLRFLIYSSQLGTHFSIFVVQFVTTTAPECCVHTVQTQPHSATASNCCHDPVYIDSRLGQGRAPQGPGQQRQPVNLEAFCCCFQGKARGVRVVFTVISALTLPIA